MFSSTVQPSVISLFSSTGCAPLQLFQVHTDPDPEISTDSVACFVKDFGPAVSPIRRATSQANLQVDFVKEKDAKLIEPSPLFIGSNSEEEDERDETGRDIDRDPRWEGSDVGESRMRFKSKRGRELGQTVLHLQSPTIRTTYIRCPMTTSGKYTVPSDLGITLPWLHIQVRPLGDGSGSGRDVWAFDIGVVDRSGKRGVIRASTFQKEATLKLDHNPTLLQIPLRMPPRTSSTLTSWTTIDLDVAATVRYFGILANAMQTRGNSSEDYERDSQRYGAASLGTFASVTFIKVYANCRLRRVWFSENRHSNNLPWEFQLYAAEQ